METQAMTFRIGSAQHAALVIYVFDGFHAAFGDAFPGELTDDALRVSAGERDRAFELLTDAANSADEDGDRELRDALTKLASRVLRAKGVR